MKKFIFLCVLFAFSLSLRAQDSGIRFFHGTWDEAIALAKKEKKKLFVDFYTEWCGPCLNMSLTVFVLPQVGEVYNKNFVCLKIDAEKGEGRELAKRYAVNSYPTYIFVNPKNQEIVHRSGSNKPVEDFLYDAQGGINPKLGSVYMDKKYTEGKYDLDFLKNYIRYKKSTGSREVQTYFDELISKGAKLTDADVWNLYRKCITGYQNPYLKEVSDNYVRFTELFGKKEVDEKLTEATSYAPVQFTKGLCDFEGKDFNIKMRVMTDLFNQKKYDEAFAEVERLKADPSIDQHKFVKSLVFHVRVSPEYTDKDLPYETLANKVRALRYVAYNMYDRDDAMPHFYYVQGLEYLLKRALEEGKQIPTDLVATPAYGKKVYDMRHPDLKVKPKRR